MPRLEYDVVFNINTSSVETLEQNLNNISSAGSSDAIEQTEKDVQGLNTQLERTSVSADEARQALQGVSSGTTQLQGSMSSVNNQQETFNKTANNSNQILFSFGDAMQDSAQFSQGFSSGMRAVGNNLTFASEQISIMVAKAGSGRAAMKSLAGAMLGPAGLVFGINTLVTVITLWSQSASRASKETKELNSEVTSLADELTGLRGEPALDPLGTMSSQERIQNLSALNDQLDRLLTLRGRQQELERAISDLETAGVESGLENLREQLSTVNERITVSSEAFESLNESQLKTVRSELDSARAKQALNEALLELNPALQFQRNLSEDLTPVLRDYNLGLQGSESALRNLIDSYDAQIKNLRQSRNLTEQEKNILFALTEARDKATSALDDETDAINENTGALTGNLATRFRLRNQMRALNQMGTAQVPELEVSGAQQTKSAAQRQAEEVAEFYNVRKEKAREWFSVQRSLERMGVNLVEDSEKTKSEISKAQSEARKNATLTAIQSVGTGLTQLFEKQKGVAVAGAIINAGAAITRQFKDLPLWAAIPSAAIVAAKTAKQIQQITSTEIGDTNAPSAGGGGAGAPNLQGFQTSSVERSQPDADTARNPSAGNQSINIELRTEADNRVISKKATQGGKEIRKKAIKVS